MKFTQDGTRLISASPDRNLVIHDPINLSIVGRLLGHQDEVLALDISADGLTVVSGAIGSRVLRWSLTKSGNESFDFGVIKTSSVLEDGRILMLRDDANDLEYYDPVSSAVEPVHAERLVRAMRENQAEPIAFSPTAKWAVSIDGSKLAVWNVFTGELERILEHASGSIGGAIFSPDGNFLVTGSGDSEARLWQIPDWTSQRLGPKVIAYLNNWAAFSRDRRRVAISGQDERIKLYDFEQEPRNIVWRQSKSPSIEPTAPEPPLTFRSLRALRRFLTPSSPQGIRTPPPASQRRRQALRASFTPELDQNQRPAPRAA